MLSVPQRFTYEIPAAKNLTTSEKNEFQLSLRSHLSRNNLFGCGQSPKHRTLRPGLQMLLATSFGPLRNFNLAPQFGNGGTLP